MRKRSPLNPGSHDLSWLDSVDEEVLRNLLPLERCIIVALKAYRDGLREAARTAVTPR